MQKVVNSFLKYKMMTAIQVNEQIKILRKAGKAATKSKATALQFLIDAGIVKESKATCSVISKTKKNPAKIEK